MEFQSFPKIPRVERRAERLLVTEKMDGTNAQIAITEDGQIFAGSRNRWLSPGKDNYGFAAYVEANREELLKLGPGRHYGEWYGRGIGPRGYGLSDRRLALFDVLAWRDRKEALPSGVELVTVLFEGWGDLSGIVQAVASELRACGSKHVPEYLDPEGAVVSFHSGERYKVILPGAKRHPSAIEQ